jgi:hypothetical protein
LGGGSNPIWVVAQQTYSGIAISTQQSTNTFSTGYLIKTTGMVVINMKVFIVMPSPRAISLADSTDSTLISKHGVVLFH